MVGVLVYTPGNARRSHGDFPDLFSARSEAIFLPAEGGQPRHVYDESGACAADVSAELSLDHGQPAPGGEVMTRATQILCLMYFAGNALLLWLAYYWLGVGESTI